MRTVKTSISEDEFHKVISSLKTSFFNKKEKIVCLGDYLYIRYYFSSQKTVFFIRHPQISKMHRIGEFPELSYRKARDYTEKYVSELLYTCNDSNIPPLFGEFALEWLSTKRKLARFPNIRKSATFRIISPKKSS